MQKICIVIPCYNEEQRFDRQHFAEFLAANRTFDFCLINDGSSDGTERILAELSQLDSGRIHTINLVKNVGKAEAIRTAIFACMERGSYEYIGYIDADFSAPLQELDHIIAFCNGRLKHGIIAGSRVKRLGAKIERSAVRHYLGRIFATLAGWLLKLSIYDSQCGLKFVSVEFAKGLFNEPFLTKWLFDLELWLRLRNKVGSDLINTETLEVPLNEWQEKQGSKLKFTNFLTVPIDLVRIHRKYNTRRARRAVSH